MLIYLEFSLELCWATGSVIPHVFYVSQRGFWVLCWRIKALFGGTCSLTIQLDKLNFPCNLNKLCQNVNCARIQSYLLTPSECVRFPSHPHSPFKMENSFGCLCPSPSHPPESFYGCNVSFGIIQGISALLQKVLCSPLCGSGEFPQSTVFTFIHPRNSSSLGLTV